MNCWGQKGMTASLGAQARHVMSARDLNAAAGEVCGGRGVCVGEG